MQRFLVLVAAATLVSGCSSLLESAQEQVADTTSSTTTSPPVVTAAPTETTSTEPPPCLAGDRPFSDDGVISAFGAAGGDATQISGIRWAPHPGCERVVVDLLTADGAPAGAVDSVGVDYRTPEGVIRVNLPPAIARSAVADSLIDGDLVQRAYVVATREGHLAIDLHVTPGISIELRAFEVTSPSRIVVDVRHAEEASEVLGVASKPGIVLVSPLPLTTDTSVVVSGYVRGAGEEVIVRVFEGQETPTSEHSASLSGDATIWREFEVPITGLPAGQLEVSAALAGSGIEGTVRVEFDATRVEPTPAPEL